MTQAEKDIFAICMEELEKNDVIIMKKDKFDEAFDNHHVEGYYTPVQPGEMDYDGAFASCFPAVDTEKVKKAIVALNQEYREGPGLQSFYANETCMVKLLLGVPERILNMSGEKIYSARFLADGIAVESPESGESGEQQSGQDSKEQEYKERMAVESYILAKDERELYRAVVTEECDRCRPSFEKPLFDTEIIGRKQFYYAGKPIKRRFSYQLFRHVVSDKEEFNRFYDVISHAEVNSTGVLENGRHYTLRGDNGEDNNGFTFERREDGHVSFFCESWRDAEAFYGGESMFTCGGINPGRTRIPIMSATSVPQMAGSVFSDYAAGCNHFDRFLAEGEEFGIHGMEINYKTWEYRVKEGFFLTIS